MPRPRKASPSASCEAALYFPSAGKGNNLKWRATLSSTATSATPSVDQLIVTYSTQTTPLPTNGELVDIIPAELDGDANPEYVVANIADEVFAFDTDYTGKWGRSGLGYVLSLAKGDVNNDGKDDIIVGTKGTSVLYVLNGVDGATLAGFPIGNISLFTDNSAAPAGGSYTPGTSYGATAQYCHIVGAANLDADANKEIIAATPFGVVLAYDDNGTKLWQYNVDTAVKNCKRIIALTVGEITTTPANREEIVFTVTNQNGSYSWNTTYVSDDPAEGTSGTNVGSSSYNPATFEYLYGISSTGGALFSTNLSGLQRYPDPKPDTICLVDSNADGVKDRIAVGCSDNKVRYYNFSGTLQATSDDCGSAVYSIEARDCGYGSTAEETLAGTKNGMVYCLTAAGTGSNWNKNLGASNFVFRIINQNITNRFEVAARNNQYILDNSSNEINSFSTAQPGYAGIIINANIVYINWDKNIYLIASPGTPYVEIPNPARPLLTLSKHIKVGQQTAYVAFDLRMVQNGSTTNFVMWKNFRIDKRTYAHTIPDDKLEVSVWEETTGNGRWDNGDRLVAKGNFTNATVTLNMKRYEIDTNTHTFYIVLKLDASIGGGQKAGVRVADPSYMEFEDAGVSAANF